MRNFLVLVIILGLGYFAYQTFVHSAAVNTESANQRAIRENHLEDIEEYIPPSSQDALIEVKGDIDGFFKRVQEIIRQWRIEVQERINEIF
ncbi:hypothetical protein KC901_00250 [Patescibacteria group bacterium]|nr:hypothetical protein [Patescibacteria group bacterium]